MESSIVDIAAVSACHKQINSLRDRLHQLETRKDNLLRMQRRLADFQSAQNNKAEMFASSFNGVQFALHFATRIREAVDGPYAIAADSQVSTSIQKVYREIGDVTDQIRLAQRHLTTLQEGNY